MLNFLGIGAQKAATTWLFANLDRHPEIAFPAGKEVHFWDRREGRPAQAWLELFEGVPEGIMAGEVTPAYACLDAPSIRAVRECAPGLRIFYSLRNPLERAWSAALMALQRSELELHEASDAWFVDHFRSAGSRARGDYLACLRAWRSSFPADQIHLVFHDEILSEPRQVLAGLAEHLGADPRFFDSVSDAQLRERVLEGKARQVRPSLLPVLHELYDEPIEALADFLGRDLEAWLRL